MVSRCSFHVHGKRGQCRGTPEAIGFNCPVSNRLDVPPFLHHLVEPIIIVQTQVLHSGGIAKVCVHVVDRVEVVPPVPQTPTSMPTHLPRDHIPIWRKGGSFFLAATSRAEAAPSRGRSSVGIRAPPPPPNFDPWVMDHHPHEHSPPPRPCPSPDPWIRGSADHQSRTVLVLPGAKTMWLQS